MKKVDLFHTPDSFQYIIDWIENHPAEDIAHLMTAAMMTWNLACEIAEREAQQKCQGR